MFGLGVAGVLASIGLFVAGGGRVVHPHQGQRRPAESRPRSSPFGSSGRRKRCSAGPATAATPEDIPDLPARAFSDEAGRVQLIAAHFVNRQFVGHEPEPLEPSVRRHDGLRHGRDPARFNDREWLAAPYTQDGRTVYALVHNEYQGHQHPGRCPSGDLPECWYNAITLAVSRDGGSTFRDARPPPAASGRGVPYRYVPDAGPYGFFGPSNIVRKDDGYYYAIVRAAKHRTAATRLVPAADQAPRRSELMARVGRIRLRCRIRQPIRRPASLGIRSRLRAGLPAEYRHHAREPHLQHVPGQVRARRALQETGHPGRRRVIWGSTTRYRTT